MAENVNCKLLCNQKELPVNWEIQQSKKVAERIEHEYFVHLLVDNLPVATRIVNPDTMELQYEHGYRLGMMNKGIPYINNHLRFVLSYHMHSKYVAIVKKHFLPTGRFLCHATSFLIPVHSYTTTFVFCREQYRVVGFEVETLSVDQNEIKFEGDECNFPDNPKPQRVNPDGHTSLYFTYSVIWKESQVKWASRWDYLLGMNDVQIHWFSIINSLIVVFFLSGELTDFEC